MFVRAAKQLGAELPYLWRTHGKNKLKLNRGMNFAFGGSEVFDNSPVGRSPNISTQVGFLVDLALARRVYTIDGDLASSYALLSYSGSDYYSYIDQNPNMAVRKTFIFPYTTLVPTLILTFQLFQTLISLILYVKIQLK